MCCSQINEVDLLYRDFLCRQIDNDLSDPDLWKRVAIETALRRLSDQIVSLEQFAYGPVVDGPSETRCDGLSEGSIGEFLNNLPGVINGYSMRIFDSLTALGQMICVRDVDTGENDFPTLEDT